MLRYASRVAVVLVPLALAACSNPVSPIGTARVASPLASAHDVIVDSPDCRSGYNVTQGRCE